MVLSQSRASDIPSLADTSIDAISWPAAISGPTAYQDNRTDDNLIALDLRGSAGFGELRRVNDIWPTLPASERREWLRRREIILPPRVVEETEVALLPGGAVAVRGPDSLLVCDPVEAAIFNHAEVKHLRRVLRTRADVYTLMHTADGVIPRQRVPKSLPPQAVTIVPNPTRLPIRVSFAGPILIQWGLNGAVARPLVPAPSLIALAVGIAPSSRIRTGPGLVQHGPMIVSETWQAADAADRWKLISAAVTRHLDELVAGTVCDELRLALGEACVAGQKSLAPRIAKALAVLPTCFAADPDSYPGSPPPAWRHAMSYICESLHPRAFLGMDKLTDPVAAIRSLRDTLEHADVMAFDEAGDALPGGPVPLRGDAALFLARKAGLHGRLAVAIPTPASPVDLYSLTYEVAQVTQGRIIAVAPGWGFCHRIGPDDEENGNAGWFGMGAGLDELDIVLGDIELDA
jgi:hypothetical protein